MNRNKLYITFTITMLLMTALVSGCSQEDFATQPTGMLHLGIGHSAKATVTRANPHQMGKPMADKFNLRIQRKDNVFYEGKFVESLELKVGSYDIIAYYGEDVVIGKDTPYYEGVATALIEEDMATSVTIPCRVANSLISVVFGRDEIERARFDKYYVDYGLIVKVDDHSLAVGGNEPESSIYFPAGSSPTLFFYGTLKDEDERFVWREVTSDALPSTFAAADHAIVTLNLPEPESALNVDIAKVEVVTAMLDETIPLSWLPISTATAQHHYDSQGILMGTDVIFSNSYPGMQWKAVVTNAKGEEVRIVEGTEGSGAELISSYSSSSEYPYLSSGEYKATFYLEDEGTFNKVGSRDFSVGKPELKLLLGGYSSYTKYLEGDIDAANGCDRKTIYDISVMFNVSEALLAIFPYTFTFQYASKAVEKVATGKNTFKMSAPLTNQAVSLTPYRLKADASFDGIVLSNYKDFYITGLPATYLPPTIAAGWKDSGERVSFNGNEVRLGGEGGFAHYDEYIYNQDFAIPRHTMVALNYNVMIHTATTATTLTITLGKDVMFSEHVEGGAFNSTDKPYNGTITVSLAGNSTELKCHNSYGGGLTCSYIYSLKLDYGNK